MDAHRFDALSKTLAGRLSRRTALRRGGFGLAGAAAALVGMRAAAQDAAQGTAAGTAGPLGEDATFLFAQTAGSGSFRPNPGAGTPVAADGSPPPGGGTVYFSDRPERIFGEAPTERFLDGLGFTPANPPNAALVDQTAGDEAVVVVELVNPVYDEGAASVTYGAKVLTEYAGEGLAHVADRQVDAASPEEFGRVSLFIDDCADADPLNCWADCNTNVGNLGDRGMCWKFGEVACRPCGGGWDGTASECNAAFSACDGKCFTDYVAICGYPG